MAKVCPRCGAREGDKRFVGFFCEDCYGERLNVEVESPVAIEQCKACGRIRQGRDWVRPSKAVIEGRMRRAVKGRADNVRFVYPESLEGECQAVIIVSAGEGFVECVKPFSLARRVALCTDCSRATSGYFEAIVQVRAGTPEKSRRLADRIARELCKKTFIAKEEEVHNGLDIYAGSNKAVMETLERMKLHAEKTAKLHGLKDGQRVYRTTYCVRG
jgi:NMD protein affecting ribosome stability and mRNA decay